MKSPLIVLFIIFNLLSVNLVAAINMHDEQTTESHLVQKLDDTALVSSIDEPDCDHHCHFSSHMTGLITYTTSFSTADSSISYDIRSDQLYSIDLGQLIRPPKA